MEPQKKPIHLNENDTPYLYEPFRNQMPAKRQHPAEKEKILKPWQGLLKVPKKPMPTWPE